MKYDIIPKYLTAPSKRRSGILMNGVNFIVSHDTGNPASTAFGNVLYYERSRNDMSASAQDFVDDEAIYECIPFFTGPPEKAWHVIYNTPIDNRIFGCDANDYAVGIELCYGGDIDLRKAYEKYVWLHALACKNHRLDPATRITGHHILDPNRKTDPMNAFRILGITFNEFVADVVKEFNGEFDVKGHSLDQAVAESIINTWISPAWFKAKEVKQQNYIHWLANQLRDAASKPLDPGVAETVINTWISPSWFASKDEEEKKYIHWLADQLRSSAGLF